MKSKNKKRSDSASSAVKKQTLNKKTLIRASAIFCAALLVVTAVVLYEVFADAPNMRRAVNELVNAINDFDDERVEGALALSQEETDEIFFWGLDDEGFEAYTYILDELPGTGMFLRYAASHMSLESLALQGDKALAEFRYLDLSEYVSTVFGVYQTYILTSSLEGTELLPRDEAIDGIIVKLINDGYHFNFKTAKVTLDLVKTEKGYRIASFDTLDDIVFGELFTDPEGLTESIAQGFASSENAEG